MYAPISSADIREGTTIRTPSNSTQTYAGDYTNVRYFWNTPLIILGHMLLPLDHCANNIRRTLNNTWTSAAFQEGW